MVPRSLTLACVFFLGSVPTAHAQTLTDPQLEELYEQAKLDTTPTIASNLLVPGLGNMYARQNFAAVGFFGLFGMGLTATLFGAINNNAGILWPGVGILAISYTASSITTYYGVQAYNARLRQRYGLPPVASERLPGVTVSWRF